MHNIIFLLIILCIYSIITLICIIFNTMYPKKYTGLIAISHIFGIFTTIFFILGNIVRFNFFINISSAIFFLFTNFIAIFSLMNFINIHNKYNYKYFIIPIAIIVLDVFFMKFFPPVTSFIHKVLIMGIYIFIGILIIKNKNNNIFRKCLGGSCIVFPAIQIIIEMLFLFVVNGLSYFDLAVYLIQVLTCSLFIIFITIEEERKKINEHMNILEERVKDKDEFISKSNEVNKLKTEILANISHDFRTPINVIFSSIQLVKLELTKKEYWNNNKTISYLEVMKENCYRLIKLSNNFIDMSKIEAGFMELNLHNVDIVKIIEDITLSIVPFAEERGIHIIFDTEMEEKMAACDVEKIERIMLNLLSNAIKFTPKDGEINVYMYEDNNNICFSVKDNGVGIPKNMHDKVFHRFAQVKDEFLRQNEGSGIGLSLVKHLVEMHGGSIVLESDINRGCKFLVSIPYTIIQGEDSNNFSHNEIDTKRIEMEISDI